MTGHIETFPSQRAEFVHSTREIASGTSLNGSRPATLNLLLRNAATGEPLPGLIRISPIGTSAPPLFLDGVFQRSAGWFSSPARVQLRLPHGRYRIEAAHGIDTSIARAEIALADSTPVDLTLDLHRIYDPGLRDLRSGNTHLHLILDAAQKMGVVLHSRSDAEDYLQTVGLSDGLDVLFVSYLTRPGEHYVSNDFTNSDLAHLSSAQTHFAGGVELRHESRIGSAEESDPSGSASSMSYGHVMLLGLTERILPASIGPGLSEDSSATDGVPLRLGILEARNADGSVIWCHGTSGLEGISNWVAGLIDAQNIYDGGNHGSYEEVFYRYLNAGYKVPFSTGTDWGVWDFNRVYVPLRSGAGSETFLQELQRGRSFITNEPFLEFSVGDASIGDEISLEAPAPLRIHGRAVGRSDFVRMQVVFNGEVIHEEACRSKDGHFESMLDFTFVPKRSGWFALRIPTSKNYGLRANYSGAGTNILGKAIFAHTSPIYVTVAGKPVFEAASVEELLKEVRISKVTVDRLGMFANPQEREQIGSIYVEAESALLRLLQANCPR